jgi:hypothetical protein
MPIVRYNQKFSKRLDLSDGIFHDDSRSLTLCEWLFCLSVMFERMSIAQARVNVFMKSFCEKQILRERLWSPQNDDVSISYFEISRILKIKKKPTISISTIINYIKSFLSLTSIQFHLYSFTASTYSNFFEQNVHLLQHLPKKS